MQTRGKKYSAGGRDLTPDQVVSIIWQYMVQEESAAYVCLNVIGMSREEIGKPRTAWRKFDHIYRRFGFPKRYKGAYKEMNINKLRDYVVKYWETGASEKDLLAYFPEINADYAAVKKKDEQGPKHTGKKRKPGTNKSDPFARKSRDPEDDEDDYEEDDYEEEYEDDEDEDDYDFDFDDEDEFDFDDDDEDEADNEPITARPKQEEVLDISEGLLREYNQSPYKRTRSNGNGGDFEFTGAGDAYERRRGGSGEYFEDDFDDGDAYGNGNDWTQYSGGGTFGAGVGMVVSILLGIFVLLAILSKLGVFAAIGSLFHTIFRALEVILFYGGIVAFFISLFRRHLRYNLGKCIFASCCGLMFGAFSDGSILGGLVMFAIGYVAVLITNRIFRI